MSITSTEVPTSTRHVVIDSPVGELTIVHDRGGVSGVYFPGHRTRPDRSTFGARTDPTRDRCFDATIRQLGEYFAGRRQEFDLALNPVGSVLARRVWQLIDDIPYGRTSTYGRLAELTGGGITAREIGGLVGRNPLSILIACHRVVGSTGELTGYAGGLDRKRQLLELEGAIPAAPPSLW